MAKNRAITIDYYEIWTYENQEGTYNECKYDITEILKQLKSISVTERTFEYNDEKIRIQEVKYHEEEKLWEIQILKSREYVKPGIADDNGKYIILDLGENKYYAESITLIYDSEKCIIGMQINHNYINRTILEKIFNRFQKNFNDIIQLRPIILLGSKKKIEEAKYCTKISIAVRNPKMQNEKYDNDTLLGQVFNATKKLKGIQCKIEIGFGRNLKKKDTLDIEEVKELLNTTDSIAGIEELQIDYKNMEEASTDKVNLIKDRLQDVIIVSINKEKSISHIDIFNKMKDKYLLRVKNNMI
jgi:hypothetical protein